MKNENKSPLETAQKIAQNTCNLTLLAGLSAAIGYIAGILSAPKAGKELRREVEEKSTEIIDMAKQQIGELNKRFNPKIVSGYKNQDSYKSQMSATN